VNTVAATDSLTTDFAGQRLRLFKLAMVTAFWTVLTLGFYRFWMKSRLRRWYWSSIRPGGMPLEYVGDPFEKLLGFFMAVVIMAFYIGVVNLILMFASLSLFASNAAAYSASFIGVIPLWFFARYRARRYVLARTRWRGVRFGLEPGAWGYAARALWHWFMTLATLGILWPRKTFYLEKYRTDRTVFGSVTLHQGGTWTMLMPAFIHVLIGGFFTIGFGLEIMFQESNASFQPAGDVTLPAGAGRGTEPMSHAWAFVLTVPWFLYGLIHYNVQSKRILAAHKSAGDVTLKAEPHVGTVARIYVFGYLATILISLLPVVPITVLIGLIEFRKNTAAFDSTVDPDLILGVPTFVWTVLGITAYFAILLLWSVLRHCFVTMPIWRHYAETLTILNADGLSDISQKQRDDFREAEGFAEALDLWGAI